MVSIVLAWSLLAAWAAFLIVTTIVLVLAFRSVFPHPISDETDQEQESEASVNFMVRELESTIAKGFVGRDLHARRKTFDNLARIFRRKIGRRYGMGKVELMTLMQNPEAVEATVRDPELVELLSGNFKGSYESWDITRLSKLISKVEDWGG